MAVHRVRQYRKILLTALLPMFLLNSCGGNSPNADSPKTPETQTEAGVILINQHSRDITAIPPEAIARAKAELHIAYNHTSHGSQLITGMNCLERYPDFGSLYAWNGSGSGGALHLEDRGIPGIPDLSQGDSLDENGDSPWVVSTRAFLDDPANGEINVILWSWCSINGHYARRYVDNMEKLIAEYPHIRFVFMTGHAGGQGEQKEVDAQGKGNVHYNNELIRRHCAEKKRILYDFAAIEAYDPDGAYFWDQAMRDNLNYGVDGGNWAVQWITADRAQTPLHILTKLTTGEGVDGYDGCSGTAHSSSPSEANLNGILKGIAAWHLWARLAGWDGN